MGDERACLGEVTLQHSKTSSEKCLCWSVAERMKSEKAPSTIASQTGTRKLSKRFVFGALK